MDVVVVVVEVNMTRQWWWWCLEENVSRGVGVVLKARGSRCGGGGAGTVRGGVGREEVRSGDAWSSLAGCPLSAQLTVMPGSKVPIVYSTGVDTVESL